VRIVVVDDQEVVRAGFGVLLGTQPDFTVVGSAADGAEAIRVCRELRPDVVLMDVRMPVMDGIEATREITAEAGDGDRPRILVLTTFDLDEHVYDALSAGASGFLIKAVTADRLFDAVRVVAAGEALLAPTVTRRLIAEFARLRPRPLPHAATLGALTPRGPGAEQARAARPDTGRRDGIRVRPGRPALEQVSPGLLLLRRRRSQWSMAPWVLDRGGSDTRTGERHMRDSAGRGGGLDLVALLEALQSVPEAYASAEQDRDHHDVHVVDEPGSKEVADHGGTPADADVLAARSLAGRLERLGRRGVDEVEGRAALHLDRRAPVMGEDEGRCVEWWVGTPPTLPLRVLLPSGRAELVRTHDLGTDPDIVQPREGIVDAAGAAGLAGPLVPPPGVEHPLVQPFASVAERCVEALTFAGAETVERDGEELDAGE
jgi:DNA-binding NarL/FixJ family response regulator